MLAASALARTSDLNAQQLTWSNPFRTDSTTLFLGLKPIMGIFPIERLPIPGDRALFLRTPFTSWVREWDTSLQRTLEQQRAAALLRRWYGSAPSAGLPAQEVSLEPDAMIAARDTAPARQRVLTGKIGDYADLGMRVEGTGEMGGAWTRFQPCDPGAHLTCNPGLFPQLKPDVQFGVQVAGTISERVHVNVDYDQRREFDAANNINVFYQGFEDEVLQRVEVGDVNLRLPASRYLTQGIPAGNFGFKATGQLGPIEFQSVFAQQRGDVTTRDFRLGGLGAGQTLEQEAQRVLDDADYAEGQFFFLVDPDSLIGAPDIDVLSLRATDAPARFRPASSGGAIQVYRDERPVLNNPQQQAQLGYFTARAGLHSGQFRRMVQDDQYILHPSGLWIMLRSPLRPDEALAISYVTETGDTVGTFNAERVISTPPPSLKLLRGPVSIHQPGQPTWNYEMHQVYRLDSSNGVDPATIDLRISLGDISGGRTAVRGGSLPYLRLFGLDEDAPADQVDQAQIYQPGRDPFGGLGTIGSTDGTSANRKGATGTFIVFPTLRPFLRPGPVRSAGLSAVETQAVLGGDANAAIYENPDPVVRDGSGRFRLNFRYRLRVEGVVESFNLGAFGIREGSERLYLGDHQLTAGADYTIDYDVGMVTLNNAPQLFASNPGAQIRATWEQKAVFQIAPTSVFGLNGRYGNQRGELNFVSLYQAEKTLMSRPQLGLEPGSMLLGGVSGSYNLGGQLLDRLLNHVPGLRIGALSSVRLTGELAFSAPNPNTRDAAFLDDFEATDEFSLPMSRKGWVLGSRPESPQYATGVFPVVLDAQSAARLVWQHDILGPNGAGGSLLPRQSIDNQIAIAGNELPESVLWMTFGDSTPNTVGRRWRSLTNVLSTTGRDMTRSEYLEFYVSNNAAPDLALVIDIGTVSEDAFYFDANRQTNGVYPDGKPWGLGRLDQEVDLLAREVFGPDKDERGLWNQTCSGNRRQEFVLGDPNANCARNNGVPDSEDLDFNGSVDQEQAYFRYVIPISDNSEYLVRNTTATGTQFRLFRVPLRTAGRPVNGASDATWRFIKHLRMTVTATPTIAPQTFILARMRVVGSRWTKRDVNGIIIGSTGDQPSPLGSAENLQVGPVSRLTDAEYTPPPGINDELQDPSQRFGGTGIEFNEKALRMTYRRLAPGERAEVYFRYPQQSRNFLSYRQLKLWALARAGNWGASGAMRFMVKAGNDPRNYYLYQSPLEPPTLSEVDPGDWLPELAIDFNAWTELRAQAQQRLDTSPLPAGQPLVLWSVDSTHAIVLEDGARAPNLGALRELSFAVYNAGQTVADSGEVWIDDLRLTEPSRDPGTAGTFSLDIRAGDFLNTSITYANQSAVFRQLNQEATYQRNGDVMMSSSAQLGQFLPNRWGIDLPLTVTHARSDQDPTFLAGTDLRAEGLEGLRKTGSGATRVSMSLRKRTPSTNPWVGLLVNGLALRFGYNSAENATITTRSEASGVDGGISYQLGFRPRAFDATPAPVESVLRAIFPARIEDSDFFRRLAASRLRWSPDLISFGTSYYRQERRAYQFDRIIERPGDTLPRAIESPRHGVENEVQLSFLPFQPLRGSFSLRSSRDLLAAERASPRRFERTAIERARSNLGGLDIGWETNRSMNTELGYRPDITSWLRPFISYSARYGTDRSPSYIEVVDATDSIGTMQRRFQADRSVGKGLTFEPGGFARALLGLPAQVNDSMMRARGTMSRLVYKAGTTLLPIDINWNSTLGSQFDRELRTPGFGYQFGIGDFNAYRLIGGDTAVYVNARDVFTAKSGFRLPFNAQVTTSYEETTLDALDQRGGARSQFERRWPKAGLQWSRLPLPKMLSTFFKSSSFSANYERARQHSLLGGGIDQERGGLEDRAGVVLSLGLPGGFTTSYTASVADGTSTDPTGDAEHGTTNHVLAVSGNFEAPAMMRAKFQAPFAVSLALNQTGQNQCRVRGLTDNATGEESCVPFIDFRNRSLNLQVQTMVSELSVGLRLNYTSRQSFVGTRNGNSQFQLGLFGSFELMAGRELTGSGVR